MQCTEGMEFSTFLKHNGYDIIEISEKDRVQYGCNLLNLGNGTLISVNEKVARKIVHSPFFNGRIEVLDYSAITAMYGAVHCTSQVICREKVEMRLDEEDFWKDA